MDDADNTEESAEDITAADTEPSPKKAEIKGQIIYFFSQMLSIFTLELLQINAQQWFFHRFVKFVNWTLGVKSFLFSAMFTF